MLNYKNVINLIPFEFNFVNRFKDLFILLSLFFLVFFLPSITFLKVISLDNSYQNLDKKLDVKIKLLDEKLQQLDLLLTNLNNPELSKESSSFFSSCSSYLIKFLTVQESTVFHLVAYTAITGTLLFFGTVFLHHILKDDFKKRICHFLESDCLERFNLLKSLNNEVKYIDPVTKNTSDFYTFSEEMLKQSLELHKHTTKVFFQTNFSHQELIQKLFSYHNSSNIELNNDILKLLDEISILNSDIFNMTFFF